MGGNEGKRAGLLRIIVASAAFLSWQLWMVGNSLSFAAARVYLNWFLSREGQAVYQKISERNSLRTDIPKDYLPEAQRIVPKEGVHYIFSALPGYRDLRPIRKLITEALEKAGKK
jgi:hypothetical protein